MTDFRALCAELTDALDTWLMAHHYGGVPPQDGADAKLVLRARAALAQPELVVPTDEELIEVFWEHQNGMEEIWVDDWPAAARAVLARWRRSDALETLPE